MRLICKFRQICFDPCVRQLLDAIQLPDRHPTPLLCGFRIDILKKVEHLGVPKSDPHHVLAKQCLKMH